MVHVVGSVCVNQHLVGVVESYVNLSVLLTSQGRK